MKGETADYIGLILTLHKSYLATLKEAEIEALERDALKETTTR